MDLNSANQVQTADPMGTLPTQVPPINNQPQPEVATSQSPKRGRKWLKVLLVLIFLVLISAGGFLAYKYYFTPNTTYNAGVYKEPQTAAKVATPTPSGYQANPVDTSNQALDSDTGQIDKNMTNLNSDLNNVDQSVSDQQTNLQ